MAIKKEAEVKKITKKPVKKSTKKTVATKAVAEKATTTKKVTPKKVVKKAVTTKAVIKKEVETKQQDGFSPYASIAWAIGVTTISMSAIVLIFAPGSGPEILIPVIAFLSIMGIFLGFFVGRK